MQIFAKWYTDVVRTASLADYSSVKGCIAMEQNGYAIWKKCKAHFTKNMFFYAIIIEMQPKVYEISKQS